MKHQKKDFQTAYIRDKMWKCKKCNYENCRQQFVMNHIEVAHTPTGFPGYKCLKCSAKVKSRIPFIAHTKTNSICEKRLFENKNFKSESEEPLTLNHSMLKVTCLSKPNATQKPVRKQEVGTEETPITKEKSSPADQQLVIKTIKKDGPKICQKCGKGFLDKESYNRHNMMNVEGVNISINGNIFECEKCLKTFKFALILEYHRGKKQMKKKISLLRKLVIRFSTF